MLVEVLHYLEEVDVIHGKLRLHGSAVSFQLALDKFQTKVITELVRFSGMFIVCLRWVDVDTHTILLWLIIGLSG